MKAASAVTPALGKDGETEVTASFHARFSNNDASAHAPNRWISTDAGDCLLAGFASGLLWGLLAIDAALLGNFFDAAAVLQVGVPIFHPKMLQIKHDILSRFIELGEAGDDGSSFGDDKSLRDVVLNFVIAGRDTTATTLSWLTYMAMTHPAVAEKLRRELTSFEAERAREEGITLVGGGDGDSEASLSARVAQFASLLSYDGLGKLVYLHACVTETLRLYPAVPQDPKGVLEDDMLPDGTKVRAGGMVTYVPYSMGRMEYNWGPDAASFRPERWLNDDGAFRNASPFKFTAFQAGPRICLGKDSAYLQVKMALAILFRFYSFDLVENHPVKYRMMTILSMAHGLKVRVSTSV